jgi:hypothetical protein
MVDARVEGGAAIGCVVQMPDFFVDLVADSAGVPAPEHLFMINANRGPRNEMGEAPRPFVCVDCCIERWPHTAEAFRIARSDLIAVSDGAGGWTESRWDDFGAQGGRYVES